ncbi:abortive infection family protein [Actinospica sp. MGRD01-02]|uniref:Abortive infection family protein n=1 Tax=Actinospica acidithermotolerans TaxID=2828514 RepID=A0A941EIE0_9ACTN|nr:abortive infection family protein [Actinospica acidithermotolerans]MBR7829659.1 abortive infection family protein [Actinospica acidithermotolerans]
MLDLAADLTIHEVWRLFQDAGFQVSFMPNPPLPKNAGLGIKLIAGLGAAGDMNPRSQAERGIDAVDGGNPAALLKLLSLVEELTWLHRTRFGASVKAERLQRQLERTGYRIEESGRIRLPAATLASGSLEAVRDPRALQVLLARIEHALPDDPMLALGIAKELIESTARIILAQLAVTAPADADVPRLVYLVESALAIHPQSGDGMDASPHVRGLLGKLTGIPNDLAALRNTAGSGHGRVELPTGLAPRHARLALNASITWCRFALDTLGDPNAAWRSRADRESAEESEL